MHFHWTTSSQKVSGTVHFHWTTSSRKVSDTVHFHWTTSSQKYSMPYSAFPPDDKLTKGQQHSAFPLDEKITKDQQANNFCATLQHPQRDPTGYVHLCYTPGEGNIYIYTHLLSYLYARMCLTPDQCGRRFVSQVGFACRLLLTVTSSLLLQVLASRQTFLDVYPSPC